MKLPPFIPARQRLPRRALKDIPATVREEMARAGLTRGVKPGAVIGVAVGSRGVANIAVIARTVVEELRAAGAQPVILPAMGTHGGATAPGQRSILANYGITPEAVGAPVRASMEVEQLGTTAAGVPIWFSREALRCDGVIVINRVKPHSDFRGPTESGVMKMITIGLGKAKGAAALHHYRVEGLRDHVPAVAREVIRRGHIRGGIAIVENGWGDTMSLTAAAPNDIEEMERRLLPIAKRYAPRLPFDQLDAMIVNWMGKNISGVGLDPMVLGRMRMPGEAPEFRRPRIRHIVTLRLTPQTYGNAAGVGLCDFVPRSLAEAIDWRATKANALTGGFLDRVKLPLVMDHDREAIEACVTVAQPRPPEEMRILRINDTAHVGDLWISPPLEQEARRRGLEILGPAQALRFDRQGRILDLPAQT